MSLTKAIGPRDGDYIELRNAWAMVVIARNKDFSRCGNWIVSGDIDKGHEREFASLNVAVQFAWSCLAEYQAGRAD